MPRTREQNQQYVQRHRRRDPRRYRFDVKRWNAKKAGIYFSLTFDDVTWPDRCPALGTTLDYSVFEGRKDPRVVPSFDRIDAAVGYEPGNVVIISQAANVIKNEYTAAEIRAVADWLDSLARSK